MCERVWQVYRASPSELGVANSPTTDGASFPHDCDSLTRPSGGFSDGGGSGSTWGGGGGAGWLDGAYGRTHVGDAELPSYQISAIDVGGAYAEVPTYSVV